jgi:GNAT superfamily N-acetyltransferase
MIRIEKVETLRQRKEFADYPNKLYKDAPHYLPSLYTDELETMDPEKNFAFSFCEAQFWLAKRDSETVGRIAAIINHKADQKWNKKQMRFWQADFVDDPEVSAALFDVVEKWAKEKGCNEIVGPLGFTDLDLEGMLVDGFDETGVFCTYYNHPYYQEHLCKLGYEKDVDWVEYKMIIPDRKDDMDTIARMSEFSQRVYKLHLKECSSVKDIGKAAPEIVNLINITYDELYSTTELDIDQGAQYFRSFQIVLNPKTSALVYNESDDLVGFILAIPDISKAIKKSKGRILPFGWLRILHAIKTSDEYIALLIGVHPEYRSKGVITVLINRLIEGFWDVGAKTCRICPMLENNTKVLSLMNIIPSEPYKRRRSFIKKLI